MEREVLDLGDVFLAAGRAAAGVGRRDEPVVLRQLVVEGEGAVLGSVDVEEAVQVQQRRAVTRLVDLDGRAADLDLRARAHAGTPTAAGSAWTGAPVGKARPKYSAESARSLGMTSSAKM